MAQNKEEKKHYFRTFLIFVILFACITIIYARYLGTSGLVIREYIVESPKIPDNYDGLKIVHFSDLHYGKTVFISQLENIVSEINLLKPDIIVFTGDLIDNDYQLKNKESKQITEALNKLDTNSQSYIIKGNHDKSKDYLEIISNTNFKFLENAHDLFYYNDSTPILIAGLDDDLIGNQDISKTFEGIDPEQNYYTVMLAHEPDSINKLTDYQIDLFLSGHSHNGQVRLPFIGAIIKPIGAKIYYDERYQVGETSLFISGGLGTSTLPLRLFNKPSINLYRFMMQ